MSATKNRVSFSTKVFHVQCDLYKKTTEKWEVCKKIWKDRELWKKPWKTSIRHPCTWKYLLVLTLFFKAHSFRSNFDFVGFEWCRNLSYLQWRRPRLLRRIHCGIWSLFHLVRRDEHIVEGFLLKKWHKTNKNRPTDLECFFGFFIKRSTKLTWLLKK